MGAVLVLDRFPWFALLQYLVRPSRLRGGIKFQPLHGPPPLQAGGTSTTYFELLSQPASVAPFFAWFHRLLALLAGGYTARYMCRCLLLGHELQPARDCRAQLR
eukprot:7390162-Prymnesium_polylepis.1